MDGSLRPLLPDTAHVDGDGHLYLGGCDVVALAEQHGTPLYVYDETTLRARMRLLREGLCSSYHESRSRVCYAAKAYCAPWLLRMVAEEGLGLDVVSGGELFTALHAGFPAHRIYFHGNNKGEDEVRLALDRGVGRIVLDNLEEIERVGRLARSTGRRQDALLRVTPGVEAHTHEHIKTGVQDTKFGLNIATGAAEEGVRRALAEPGIRLLGLHAHIGSQILELAPYREAIERVVEFAARLRDRLGFELQELSPGGGFGIAYTPADAPLPAGSVTREIGEAVLDAIEKYCFDQALPTVTIEPGRSIVGPAGVAVYRVGSVKDIRGVRTYAAVDGGMADNMRPTTYGAVYSALLANRADEEPSTTVAIAGKYCESGDVLIREASLPEVRVGDLVAIPGSGAYHLAMSSNYNMSLRPAVVVVADGQARLVRRRETYEDLLRAEL